MLANSIPNVNSSGYFLSCCLALPFLASFQVDLAVVLLSPRFRMPHNPGLLMSGPWNQGCHASEEHHACGRHVASLRWCDACYNCSFLPSYIVHLQLTSLIDFLLTVLPERLTPKCGFHCYMPRMAPFFFSHGRLSTSCVTSYTALFPSIARTTFPLYPSESFC